MGAIFRDWIAGVLRYHKKVKLDGANEEIFDEVKIELTKSQKDISESLYQRRVQIHSNEEDEGGGQLSDTTIKTKRMDLPEVWVDVWGPEPYFEYED